MLVLWGSATALSAMMNLNSEESFARVARPLQKGLFYMRQKNMIGSQQRLERSRVQPCERSFRQQPERSEVTDRETGSGLPRRGSGKYRSVRRCCIDCAQ